MTKQQKKQAVEFDKIIENGRERKKNEALAAQIFNRNNSNRRASAPAAGGSLASRVGVKKRTSVGGATARNAVAGNINQGWTHDLHPGHDRPFKGQKQQQQTPQQPKPNSLAARIHRPGTAPPKQQQAAKGGRANNRTAKLANALSRTDQQQTNVKSSSGIAGPPSGMTIRGLAGPFVVQAQNFAPGTTAADIESAMTPVAGLITSCRLLKTQPLVVAEIVFENKEGADRVIQTFNNQTADGRTLSVYHQPAGSYRPTAAPTAPRAHESRGQAGGVVVDGSMGFEDNNQMDIAMNGSDNRNGKGGLYSDTLVSQQQQRPNGGGGGRRGGPRGGGGGFRAGRGGR